MTRNLQLLLLASCVIAFAAATVLPATAKATESNVDMSDAQPLAKQAVMQAAQVVARHMAKLRPKPFVGTTLGALQTMTEPLWFLAKADTPSPREPCDQVGYAAAQMAVLEACPTLPALFSGAAGVTDVLPTFCGSKCHAVSAASLTKHTTCLDAKMTLLVEFADGCVATPECFTESALKAGQQVAETCGTSATTLLNFNDAAAAAKRTIVNFCTTCLQLELAYLNAYPRCAAADAASAAGLASVYSAMCQQADNAPGSDYCAWNLRSIGKIDCAHNCYYSDWCDNSCGVAVTPSQLVTMCNNTCLAALANVAPVAGVDKVLVSALSDFFCAAAPNSTQKCYIVTNEALSTYHPAVSTICAGSGSGCLSTYFSLSATLMASGARSHFDTCAASVGTAAHLYAYCQSVYERELRSAELLRAKGGLVCSTNSAGEYCAVSAMSFTTSSCFQYAQAGLCSPSCAATLAGYASTAGCCLGAINDYLRASSLSYPASYLPSGVFVATLKNGSKVNYTFSPTNAVANPDRSMQPLNALAVCSNTSDLWAAIETPCAASGIAVARSFKARLSYAAVTADAATRQRIIRGLKADAANAANVPPSSIKNETISEDTSVRVATSSRHSSGLKFSFMIDGVSVADVAKAVASFDRAAKLGVMTVNMDSVAAASCMGCLPAVPELAPPPKTVRALPSPRTADGMSNLSPTQPTAMVFVAAVVFGTLLLRIRRLGVFSRTAVKKQ